VTDDTYLDEPEFDEELLNAEKRRRKAARKAARQPEQRTRPASQIDELVEPSGLEAGFNPTYQPARFEAGWLLESLRTFYDQHLITDVLAMVKGGKEASVYCCRANPVTGAELLAAKVYRPRMFRNLRNDKQYREGRQAITSGVRQLMEERGTRLGKLHPGALSKNTAFGAMLQHTSWLSYEFQTLDLLHRLGAAVPRPLAMGENALLMSYHGDEQTAAPTLNSVRLDRAEAEVLFAEVIRNVELMLGQGLIHGDLSAYNILYWQGAITIIDFPQVTSSQNNRSAQQILARDIRRVCEYFAQQGVQCKPDALTHDLWQRYAALHPDDQAADLSGHEPPLGEE
jgi:RIO kinase 1